MLRYVPSPPLVAGDAANLCQEDMMILNSARFDASVRLVPPGGIPLAMGPSGEAIPSRSAGPFFYRSSTGLLKRLI